MRLTLVTQCCKVLMKDGRAFHLGPLLYLVGFISGRLHRLTQTDSAAQDSDLTGRWPYLLEKLTSHVRAGKPCALCSKISGAQQLVLLSFMANCAAGGLNKQPQRCCLPAGFGQQCLASHAQIISSAAISYWKKDRGTDNRRCVLFVTPTMWLQRVNAPPLQPWNQLKDPT